MGRFLGFKRCNTCNTTHGVRESCPTCVGAARDELARAFTVHLAALRSAFDPSQDLEPRRDRMIAEGLPAIRSLLRSPPDCPPVEDQNLIAKGFSFLVDLHVAGPTKGFQPPPWFRRELEYLFPQVLRLTPSTTEKTSWFKGALAEKVPETKPEEPPKEVEAPKKSTGRPPFVWQREVVLGESLLLYRPGREPERVAVASPLGDSSYARVLRLNAITSMPVRLEILDPSSTQTLTEGPFFTWREAPPLGKWVNYWNKTKGVFRKRIMSFDGNTGVVVLQDSYGAEMNGYLVRCDPQSLSDSNVANTRGMA